MLEALTNLPEGLCDRGLLLRRLLTSERSTPVTEQGSPLGDLLRIWLPLGRRSTDFTAWADFLEQCTSLEVRRSCPCEKGRNDWITLPCLRV